MSLTCKHFSAQDAFDLHKPHQHTRPYNSSWISKALNMGEDETLRRAGLDVYMYLRFLRLGASICGFGSLLSLLLIPIYATASSSVCFSPCDTLACVESGSTWQIWVTVFSWWAFIAFVLRELWNEWAVFHKNRSYFAARGDEDIPMEVTFPVQREKKLRSKLDVTNKEFQKCQSACQSFFRLYALIEIAQVPQTIYHYIATGLAWACINFMGMIIGVDRIPKKDAKAKTPVWRYILILLMPFTYMPLVPAIAKTPVWRHQMYPIILILLMSFMYMPIVPIMELFGLVYFVWSYHYMVWKKHQCLHPHAKFEGGGEATWEKAFGFLITCLCIQEAVFILIMFAKQALIQGCLGFVPLVVTGYMRQAMKESICPTVKNPSPEED